MYDRINTFARFDEPKAEVNYYDDCVVHNPEELEDMLEDAQIALGKLLRADEDDELCNADLNELYIEELYKIGEKHCYSSWDIDEALCFYDIDVGYYIHW